MVEVEGLGKLMEEHPFFIDMPRDMRELIAGCAANERFNAGDYIYREGQDADKFYLLRHGAVALEVYVPGREPLVVESLSEGDILGWSWLVPPYKCSFDARASTLVRAISLDATCLRAKCEKDPSLGYEFYKRFVPVIADRLAHARIQMIDMYAPPAGE